MNDAAAGDVARLKAKAETRGKERLWSLLDSWAGIDESRCSEAEVTKKFRWIMVFFERFVEAEDWYAEWRRLHPEARLV